MALTDASIKNAKPGPKLYRLLDARGLYLEINSNGSKLWRFRYSFHGKNSMIALGSYPATTLKDARHRCEDARRLLESGADPAAAKKTEKIKASGLESFEAIAREWHERQKPKWVEAHASKIIRRFEENIFPWIGVRPISEVTAPELLSVLRRIEARGAIETAHRAHQTCSQVFRYAVATGRADRDPAADLRGALTPAVEKHRAAILDPKGVGQLLRAIDSYPGGLVTRCAFKLAPLTFVRPGELRKAEWSEIDLDAAEWRIPAEKMKVKNRGQHIVPLSRQALEVLREIQPLTGGGKYAFPSERTPERPMSEATILAALRRMGYPKEEMSGHGFRAMASTLLNEMGWKPDIIERQLAHAERNKVKAAYNRAEHLPERRKMMQAWADYLDALKTGAKVTPIRGAAG